MYIEFMTEYWYLFAMLLVIVFLISMDPASQGAAGGRSLSPGQLPQVQSREKAVIIDVRESDKFKAGHISQSINFPISSLSDSLNRLKKYQSKPVILTCELGNNAKKASAILKQNEFSDIYILNGGLAAWKKENLPLEKS